jgi:Lon protease-like protein
MSHSPSSLETFGGTARLFPLPNLVLFPHVVQPLHIFEPRYRQMTADALKSDRLLALALLRPGWEEEYHRRPPIHPVVCLGQITREELLPDGRYNLEFRGLQRARVIEELHTDKLYRLARVSLLDEVPVPFLPTEQCLRRRLGERVANWLANQSATLSMLRRLLDSTLSLSALCDIFSFALPLDNEFKQQLLEEIRVEPRVQLLLAHLEARCPSHAAASAGPRRFPPGFSTN